MRTTSRCNGSWQLAALVLAACVAPPAVVSTPTALSPEDAYGCVMRELTRAGFVVEDGDRSAGFVRAGKVVAMFGDRSVDEVHVSITTDGIRAEGRSYLEQRGERKDSMPSSAVKAVTAAIGEGCRT